MQTKFKAKGQCLERNGAKENDTQGKERVVGVQQEEEEGWQRRPGAMQVR
jgi:hypothetical protein